MVLKKKKKKKKRKEKKRKKRSTYTLFKLHDIIKIQRITTGDDQDKLVIGKGDVPRLLSCLGFPCRAVSRHQIFQGNVIQACGGRKKNKKRRQEETGGGDRSSSNGDREADLQKGER